jgi:hypothetical protein
MLAFAGSLSAQGPVAQSQSVSRTIAMTVVDGTLLQIALDKEVRPEGRRAYCRPCHAACLCLRPSRHSSRRSSCWTYLGHRACFSTQANSRCIECRIHPIPQARRPLRRTHLPEWPSYRSTRGYCSRIWRNHPACDCRRAQKNVVNPERSLDASAHALSSILISFARSFAELQRSASLFRRGSWLFRMCFRACRNVDQDPTAL